MPTQNYADLAAWQKAMDLVTAVYEETRRWPKEEIYGLTSQVRKASISIPSNIAEGQGRRSDREFFRFLAIAHGSLREVETQLMIGQRLGYCTNDRLRPLLALASETGKLVTGLQNVMEV